MTTRLRFWMEVEGHYAVDDLVDELARPIFNLRISQQNEHEDTPFGRACALRADKARKEITEIVGKWVEG